MWVMSGLVRNQSIPSSIIKRFGSQESSGIDKPIQNTRSFVLYFFLFESRKPR
jgi:hypothetical protein